VKSIISNPRSLFLLLLVLGALVAGGCASTESENLSERPWNAPQGWETGMGGMFNQYR
jgi:hypothetical protein